MAYLMGPKEHEKKRRKRRKMMHPWRRMKMMLLWKKTKIETFQHSPRTGYLCSE
jgi:3-methyladenine DNA glycosylase/8-oxoguanine DNA glycosylase